MHATPSVQVSVCDRPNTWAAQRARVACSDGKGCHLQITARVSGQGHSKKAADTQAQGGAELVQQPQQVLGDLMHAEAPVMLVCVQHKGPPAYTLSGAAQPPRARNSSLTQPLATHVFLTTQRLLLHHAPHFALRHITPLRSANRCQQLLTQQLGWRLPPSVTSWQQVQQQQLARVRLRPCQVITVPGQGGFAAPAPYTPVSCMDVQCMQCPQHAVDPQTSSSSSLVAVGYSNGVLRLMRVHTLAAAATTAVAAAALLPADIRHLYETRPALWESHAARLEGVPVGSGHPPTASPTASPGAGTVWQLDAGEQLRGCCWLRGSGSSSGSSDGGCATAAAGGEGLLVTSGPSGVVKRHFAEVRCPLLLLSGSCAGVTSV